MKLHLGLKRFPPLVGIKLGTTRALDKREYSVIIRVNFCQFRTFVVVVLLFYVHSKHLRSCWDGQFCTKTYDVTPHLNRLDETVQMRGHNIWFQ